MNPFRQVWILMESQKEMEGRLAREHPDLMIHCLSDVWLDHPATFDGLDKIFSTCIESEMVPLVFVLCGNFTSRGIAQGNSREVAAYQGGISAFTMQEDKLLNFVIDNFDRLAELIASYPPIARNTHFVFVPGPLDFCANSLLPRRPLLSSFVGKIKSRVPRAHFMSNPCRIKCFGQEIVIYREDLMARMLRNLVGVKPDVQNDDMKRFVRRFSFTHERILTGRTNSSCSPS